MNGLLLRAPRDSETRGARRGSKRRCLVWSGFITSLIVTIVGERERSNQEMYMQVLKVLQSLIGQLAGEVEVEVAVLACCM